MNAVDTGVSIKQLYPLALAEGEGVGTAYEYFAKRLVLARWLAHRPVPRRILIAGLPEKYGSSLDFFLLAGTSGAALVVVDDRPAALTKAQQALRAAQAAGIIGAVEPHFQHMESLGDLVALTGTFDLVLASEVLQRLSPAARTDYVGALAARAPALALFAPNADNPGHTNLSGLSGLHLADLRALVTATGHIGPIGYIDMPPFPPGVTRSDDQREQATSGRFEALAMWGLGWYARAEHWLPGAVRRRQSHIVYALTGVKAE